MRAQSTLQSAAQPHTPTGLARWREQTRRANAAFDRRQYAQAQRLYRQALLTAEALLAAPASAASPDDGLAALVVAHHNLAEACRRRRDPIAARAHLCLPHEALSRIVADPDAPDPVRRCAMRHLSRTRLALLDWQTLHGACVRTQAALRDSVSAIASLGAAAVH